LACTEIPIALRADMQTRALLDCTHALAWACINYLSTGSYLSPPAGTESVTKKFVDDGVFVNEWRASVRAGSD